MSEYETEGIYMIDVVNLQAIVEDHRRQIKPKRMTSEMKRVASLYKMSDSILDLRAKAPLAIQCGSSFHIYIVS